MNRITTQFGFESTASQVAAGVDLSGKRVIVTGASSGIGLETARALSAAGADVTLAVRDVAAGAHTARDIVASTGNSRMSVSRLDLADVGSVARFVADWTGPLHILVNNAGGILPTLERTPEGWEKQFAANHLGHFALAVGLRDALAAACEARIVSVTSAGHLYSPIVFDDINFEFRPYDPLLSYGQSKTANALFAVGATARWAEHGITANAAMPGPVATNFIKNVDPAMLERLAKEFKVNGAAPKFKTPEQGAATSVFVAVSPALRGIGGRYFEDANEAVLVSGSNGYGSGVAPYALDAGNADRLWDLSLRMLSIATRSTGLRRVA
jgi:NAD(P)-dependent dehydrogenase (short-subunit alcohol dehydrogenase family)